MLKINAYKNRKHENKFCFRFQKKKIMNSKNVKSQFEIEMEKFKVHELY